MIVPNQLSPKLGFSGLSDNFAWDQLSTLCVGWRSLIETSEMLTTLNPAG